jgi:hypothetical protein
MMVKSKRKRRRKKGSKRRKSRPRPVKWHRVGGKGGGFRRPPPHPPSPRPNNADPRRDSPAGISFPYQYKRPDKEKIELHTYWSNHLNQNNDRKKKGTDHPQFTHRPQISGNGVVHIQLPKTNDTDSKQTIVIKEQYSDSRSTLKPPTVLLYVSMTSLYLNFNFVTL